MATLAAQITSTGITAPDYNDILAQLEIVYFAIYGSDAVLTDDSQDGQFLAVIAQAIFDAGGTAIAVYNAFSPLTAQGVGLSSLVKLNGLRRLVSSNSQVPVVISGIVGTEINNGVIGDNQNLNTQWALPSTVTIGASGNVTVTATCTTTGATPAAANTLTVILTPTYGWQSVTNGANVASPGAPVETDAQLRVRQSNSTALPAMTVLEGIYAAVDEVNGVTDLAAYQNDTDETDSNGLNPHSIAIVVQGGDVTQVATAIALKKAPGTGTNGTTSVLITDSNGVPNTINFYELTPVPLGIVITIQPQAGYVSTTGQTLQQAVVDFVNSLSIGEDSYRSRLFTPANLGGVGIGATFVVTDIKQGIYPATPGEGDITILFNQTATASLANTSLVLV